MDGDLSISLDKLPVKRLEAIEENGAERFPPYEHHLQFPLIWLSTALWSNEFLILFLDVCSHLSYDDNRVNLIRRIDFAWAVEREDPNKKQKKGDAAATASASKDTTSSAPWPWQSMVENLQLAHQELSVIIDLINTVSNRAMSGALSWNARQNHKICGFCRPLNISFLLITLKIQVEK